jgi:hypothetical protein
VISTVFGLDVESSVDLPALGLSDAASTGRRLRIRSVPQGEIRAAWPDDARLVCDEREPDGRVVFQIEEAARAGYLLSGPHYGAHLLSPDGKNLCCATDAGADWQRLLMSQVLPFASLLHGLEVFHASAVVHDGTALMFLGASGAGKTSVAIELCERGADFLADDVVAVETREDRLMAHPGTPLAGVDAAAGVPSDSIVLSADSKAWVAGIRASPDPAPISALFFLDRRADGPAQPAFVEAGDALTLLAATFNFVISTPARLQGLLDTCALAARLRVERIVAGPPASARTLAVAVEQRIDGRT